jgi:hypothetical protein
MQSIKVRTILLGVELVVVTLPKARDSSWPLKKRELVKLRPEELYLAIFIMATLVLNSFGPAF